MSPSFVLIVSDFWTCGRSTTLGFSLGLVPWIFCTRCDLLGQYYCFFDITPSFDFKIYIC